MVAMNDGSTVGDRRRLVSPPSGTRNFATAANTRNRQAQAAAAPARDAAVEHRPETVETPGTPGTPGTGEQRSAGNVDTSLRDRINRLSSARTSLMRKRDGARAAAPAEQPPSRRPADNTAQADAAPAASVVDPDPMIVIDEPVVADPVPEARSAHIDLTATATAVPAPAAVAPVARTMPDPVQDPVVDPDAAPYAPPVAEPHPRQSARRRDVVPKTEVPAAPESDNLPTPRRSTAPEVRQEQVQETATTQDAEITALAAEIKNLRREMAELRSEIRDLKDAGPGGLGPVERAVQRLAQRMDRVDGGAQPLINDGRLEQRAPKKSGFFSWFGRR